MKDEVMELNVRPEPADLSLEVVLDTGTVAPRRLVESMGTVDQKRPILAYPDGDGRYGVVDGKRRVAAARALGWETVWALVYPSQLSAVTAAETALVGNVVRGGNPVDDAINAAAIGPERAYEIAGLTRPQYDALTRILRLRPKYLGMVRGKTLSKTAALAMARLSHEQQGLAWDAAVTAALESPRKRVTVEMVKGAVNAIRFPPGQQSELPLPGVPGSGDTPVDQMARSALRVLNVSLGGLGVMIERTLATAAGAFTEEETAKLAEAAAILRRR